MASDTKPNCIVEHHIGACRESEKWLVSGGKEPFHLPSTKYCASHTVSLNLILVLQSRYYHHTSTLYLREGSERLRNLLTDLGLRCGRPELNPTTLLACEVLILSAMSHCYSLSLEISNVTLRHMFLWSPAIQF